MQPKTVVACAALVLAWTAAWSPARASSGRHGPTLPGLIQDSELVFKGTVINVAYRESDVQSPEHVAIPYTFVTFEIEQALKGASSEQDRITIRCEGGPDSPGDDPLILMVWEMPEFDVGERGVFFIDTDEMLCPVAEWTGGRYRIVDDQVFTALGKEVWVTQSNRLVLGPARALQEVREHVIGRWKIVNEEVPVAANQPPPQGATPVDEPMFDLLIEQWLAVLYTQGELAQLPAVQSTSIDEPFFVTEPSPVAGPEPLPDRYRPCPSDLQKPPRCGIDRSGWPQPPRNDWKPLQQGRSGKAER